MGSRRKGRELALQALYQLDITSDASEAALQRVLAESGTGEQTRVFARRLVEGVLPRREEIDGLIAEAAEHWGLDRLSRVDLNVMRVAIYELTTPPGLAVEIAINEAIEVARKFGSQESATFVNGVLDHVAQRLGLKRAKEQKAEQGDG